MATVGPNGVICLYSNDGNFNTNFGTPGNSDSMRWDLSNPPTNMEMTGYFLKSSPSSDTISCKIRGGRHTDSAPNDGCCYIPQFPCTGGAMQYEVECPHPNNHSCPSNNERSSTSLAQWHGYKIVVWNTPQNCVHWEAWNDQGDGSSSPANQWVRTSWQTDCSGSCGNISSPLLRPKGSSSQATFRIDNNSGTTGKWLHVVQLVAGNSAPPTGGGGGGGSTPSTGGGTVAGGGKIYPDTNPPHVCTNVTDGGLEQGGDRREPQVACGFNFLNTEATVYINYHNVNDTLSVKLRGPKHSGIPDSDMCNNIHYINLGSGGNQAFGKQWAHTEVYCEFGGTRVNAPANTWVGIKAIEWNQGSGVHFQTWIENPEGSGWKLAADAVDNGNAGDCTGGASQPFLTSPCSPHPVSIGFRVDGLSGGGDVSFKNISVREIIGGGTPGSTTPGTTDPGTGGTGGGTPGTGGTGGIPGGTGTPGGSTGEPSPLPGTGSGSGDGGGGAGNDFNTGTGGASAQAFASGGCAIAIAGSVRAQAGTCSTGGTGSTTANPGDGGQGGTTEPKPIVTVYKDLALLYNIRTDLFDNCTISGDANVSNYTEIYNVNPVQGEYLTVFQNSLSMFVGVKLHSSKSVLYKKKIRKVTVTMKRSTGVALTGNLVMQIRDRNGNLMTEFDTKIDPATLDLNDASYDFLHNENDYELQAGDMILFSYADGGDSTNHVLLAGCGTGADQFDGFNSVYVESASGLSYDIDQLSDAAFVIYT